MEKPSSKEHAFEMLSRLSGNTHKVHTGVTICELKSDIKEDAVFTKSSETTSVTFSELPEQVIHAYIESGEPMDKAGAYGIQGAAGSLVTGIQGCYFNVMGLPLNKLSKMLIETLKA